MKRAAAIGLSLVALLALGIIVVVSSLGGGGGGLAYRGGGGAVAMACPAPGGLTAAPGLTAVQTTNADAVIAEGNLLHVGVSGEVIAIATTLVESSLQDYANPTVPASETFPNNGDPPNGPNLDSAGLFQQRISQGWGTMAQIMGPASSAATFYARLTALPNWPPPDGADAAVLGAYAQDVQHSGVPGAYETQIPRATAIVTPAGPTVPAAPVLASAPAVGVPSAPDGPSVDGGWSVAFADAFDAPLGQGLGQDNLWQYQNGGPNNPWEEETYASSQVTAGGGHLDITATPAGGGYTSGRIFSNWTWTPDTGATWAFQMTARFPTLDGLFNAFWTSTTNNTWTDERDFFEGHGGFIDTDWIFNTTTRAQDYFTGPYPSDPSAAAHTYTYLIHPDGSWSFYIDGALQTWVGHGGVSGAEPHDDAPMELIVNYALAGGGPGASSTFDVSNVVAYTDTAHAAVGGHAVGPGTAIGGAPPALAACTPDPTAMNPAPPPPGGLGLPAVVLADIANAPEVIQNVIAFALAQVGKPYQWGGTGNPSYDCSGLTQAAYASVNVSIDRTTFGQVTDGTPETEATLLPGDLVLPDASHVQLYLGSGWVVEAPDIGHPIHVVAEWGAVWQARRIIPAAGQVAPAD